MNRKISTDDKLAELTTAYDAVVGLLHFSHISAESRRKAESLLAVLAEEINQRRAEKAKSTSAA